MLGCLLEKQRTTPDQYPLTLNALRLACNQSTARDPVVDYDDHTVRDAAQRLGHRRWARLASGQGSRAPKYRHLLDEALGLPDDELAILTVLMLRGPQTPGELKGRTERLHHFADLGAVESALGSLIGRGYAVRQERRPGQKEVRYAHTLSDDLADGPDTRAAAAAPPSTPVSPPTPPPVHTPAPPPPAAPAEAPAARQDGDAIARLTAEIDELRAEVEELRDLRGELERLRSAFEELRAELGA